MEDAPLKPDPAPRSRLALARLGVTRAWMIGDTPDDVRAARAAGVVPLGVVAPGERRGGPPPSLLAAGAARVLSQPVAELGGASAMRHRHVSDTRIAAQDRRDGDRGAR